MGIWKAIPMFTNTLSCAGTSTLVGLYKSRPTDFGIAHVSIHAVGNNFIQGSSMASIFTVLLCYSFCTTSLFNFCLSTKKYSVTYSLSFNTHTLEFANLSLFNFEALWCHISGMDNLFFGESVQYMSVQLQDFIIDMFF